MMHLFMAKQSTINRGFEGIVRHIGSKQERIVSVVHVVTKIPSIFGIEHLVEFEQNVTDSWWIEDRSDKV